MIDGPLESLRAATAGRYTIEREIGRGGMATVYLARDLRHDRLVALKTLHSDLAASLGSERFLREIRIAAQLQHPNIVPVFDSGGDGGRLWYTMPHIQGESLRDRLGRESRVAPPAAVTIARQVANALAAAHASGIVHRDIKPENILLQGDHALVADFGIARATASTATASESLTGTGMSLGTPAYMSPEQISGETVDARSDIFSLGCVLYEMLAGRPPFSGPTRQAMLVKRMTEAPVPLRSIAPDVTPAVEAAVQRALATSPSDRFLDAADFAAALDGRALSASGPRMFSVASPSGRRRAVLIAATLAIGAAIATAERLMPSRSAAMPGGDRSVAVLDFENRSPDSADAYLASGLTDEVASRLSELPRLRVKGRRAVSAAEGGDYRAIGRKLGVRYLVDGRLRRSAGRMRVTVQLVTAHDGFEVWSRDYDGASTDFIRLQEDIALNVARHVAGELLPEERAALAARRTSDPAAYEHYLRGNFLLGQRSAAATARAIAHYDSALSLDPAYTATRARLAYAYAQLLDWGWDLPGVPDTATLARGFAASRRALAEDSTAAEAWLARGYLLTFADPARFAGAEEAFRLAIALDSANAESHHQFGWVSHQLGRDSLALTEYHRALALEPERASTLRLIALVHLFAGRYSEAERWLDSTLVVDPSFYSAYGLRGFARLQRGHVVGARSDGETSLRLRASDPLRGEFVLALADAASGMREAARQRVRRINLTDRGPVDVWDAWYLAIALQGIGDHAGARAVRDQVAERGVVWRFAFGAHVFRGL